MQMAHAMCDLLQGANLSRVGKTYGIHRSTVRWHALSLGVIEDDPSRGGTKLTETREKSLRTLWRSTWRVTEISKFLGVSRETIYDWADRLELGPRRVLTVERYRELDAEGESLSVIAAEFGCSIGHLYQWRKANGLPMRGEARTGPKPTGRRSVQTLSGEIDRIMNKPPEVFTPPYFTREFA